QNACSSNPCFFKATCLSGFTNKGYRCLCPPGRAGDQCEKENWKKVNNDRVCFGARGDSYGAFNIIESGLIYTFKLAHLNGNIRCSEDVAASHWGCTHESYGDKQLGTIITFKNKTALQLAEYRGDGIGCAYYSYKLDGVGVNAPILAFNNMSSPLAVSAGQEFRIWFGGDLHNCGESNNSGQTCVDVFAWYA
ncbi:unnamed protein product, partial [Porites lobata]